MAIKELQTRIALKYDSYSAWTTSPGKDLKLFAGELGICYIGDANQGSNVVPTVLFKVGDGSKTFEQLPWASAKAADVYNWAKASEVKRDGKKLVFVGGVVNADGTRSNLEVPFDYVTLAEVQEITNGLASRISAVEAKFTGDNSMQNQLDALDDRLDVLEGADTVEGSVAKALKDAKAYTNTREAAIETAYKAYADQSELDAIAAAEAKVATERARIAAVEGDITTIKGEGAGSIKKAVADAVTEVKAYADTAESDAVNTAKGYTDEKVVEVKAYADTAEADAKKYTDAEISEAVGTINAKDSAQDEEIAKKLDASTYTAYIAGKSMSDEELKAYADGKASAAQSAAEANAAATAQGKVDALKNTEVAANTAAISAMDTAYKAADTALGNRLTTVEGKLASVSNVMDFIGARTVTVSTEGVITVTAVDNETFNKGDVVVDNGGKEYVYDGSAWREFGYADSNAAAIEGLQGRMDTAEGDIDTLEASVATKLPSADFESWRQGHESDHANKQTVITNAINAEKDLREAADTAINEKIGGSYSKTATVEMAIADAKLAGTNAGAAAAAVAGRLDVAEPKITTLQDIVDGYSSKGSIKTAVDAAKEAADAAQDAADKAQDAADKAQGEVDALEGVVAGVKTTAENAASGVSSLETRMGTAEGKITTIEGDITTINGNIESLDGRITANAKAIAALDNTYVSESEFTTFKGINATAIQNASDAASTADAKAVAVAGRVDKYDTYFGVVNGVFPTTLVFNCGSATTVIEE